MNKIQKYAYGLESIAKKAGVTLNFDVEKLIDELTEASYKNNLIENLVNITDINSTSINIGEIISEGYYEEDYEILTYTRVNSEGEYFDSEEEYEAYLQNKADEEFEECSEEYFIEINSEYAIINTETEEFVIGDFKSLEDANMELTHYKETLSSEEFSKYKVTPYSTAEIVKSDEYIEDLEGYVDADTIREMAQEKIEELKEELKEEFREEFIEDEESWDELDVEFDEIYYNVVKNFDCDVDIDAAKKAGLGVVHINKLNEDFLFLQGCGMDMSFTFVKYLAYAHRAITPQYLDRLEWTKMNSSDAEFKDILRHLRVDVNRLSM
jgi:hypothetical protein